MEHIDFLANFDSVNSTIGICIVTCDNFPHARSNAPHRFCFGRVRTALGEPFFDPMTLMSLCCASSSRFLRWSSATHQPDRVLLRSTLAYPIRSGVSLQKSCNLGRFASLTGLPPEIGGSAGQVPLETPHHKTLPDSPPTVRPPTDQNRYIHRKNQHRYQELLSSHTVLSRMDCSSAGIRPDYVQSRGTRHQRPHDEAVRKVHPNSFGEPYG